MKNILVTGGNGFIGKYVVEELQELDYRVVVLDRHQWNTHNIVGPPHPGEMYFGDIKDAALVTDAVSHVDGVIHLAGILGTQETIANPVPAAETNILGGLNVIRACAQYDVPLINIAVGNWWMDNTYSISKNSIERFIKMTAKYEAKMMQSVRALNAYGPRQVAAKPYGPSTVRKIMPSFACRALTGEPIEIYGDGEQVMDMIYVTDVAEVLVEALVQLDSSGPTDKTIEAGTGRDTTVNQIAEEVVRAAALIADEGAVIKHLPMRPGEDPSSVVKADASTLHQLGIDAGDFTTLEEGVHATVKYFWGYLRP